MDVHFLKRLGVMCDGFGLEVDACAKSLRGYQTSVHYLFMERLSRFYSQMDATKSIQGKTFKYQLSRTTLSGSNVMNYLLSSFYLQESKEENEEFVIYPKISNKTSMKDEDEHISVSDYAIQLLQDLSYEGTVSLRSVANSVLGIPVSDNLLMDYQDSVLSQAIYGFLHQNSWTFPASRSLVVPGRVIRQDLVMKVKYYPARDDNRAYCQDQHVLRQIVGACLNRLVVPRSKQLRNQVASSEMYNRDDKDILDLYLPVSTRANESSFLVLLDISNFTGSLGNSWLMLHCMALDTQHNLRNKYNFYGFGDTLLVAGWHEILVLYLYLTVGYPCYVDDLDETHTLPGGFLGVNANITTGLLCLALFLKDLRSIGRAMGLTVHCQIGGDDSAVAIQGNRKKAEVFIRMVYESMNNYVGLTKEFHVINLDECQTGLMGDYTFCRKRIIHVRAGNKHILRGEVSCPIHYSILPGSELYSITDQVKAWYELDLALLNYEKVNPDAYRKIDCLRAAFALKYPRVNLTRSKGTSVYLEGEFIMHEGKLLTKSALSAVGTIERRQVGTLFAFQGFGSKLSHALHIGLVIVRKVLIRGEVTSAYLHESEEAKVQRSITVETVSLQPDEAFLSRILKLVNK